MPKPPLPTTDRPEKDPPPLLRGAGLVALVAIIAVDAATSWDPDPWVYIAGVALIVWGPRVIRR